MVAITPYEALVASASRITDTDELAEIDGSDISAASGLLEGNRFALESARQALGQRCAVPIRYEESFYQEHCNDILHLRNLARAFRVEALLAASNDDYSTATRCDPYTNKSLIYRTDGNTSFYLYSTGPKMFDGGGKFGPWPSVAAGCADLCLDAGDYWQDWPKIPSRLSFANRISSSIRMWWRLKAVTRDSRNRTND